MQTDYGFFVRQAPRSDDQQIYFGSLRNKGLNLNVMNPLSAIFLSVAMVFQETITRIETHNNTGTNK